MEVLHHTGHYFIPFLLHAATYVATFGVRRITPILDSARLFYHKYNPVESRTSDINYLSKSLLRLGRFKIVCFQQADLNSNL